MSEARHLVRVYGDSLGMPRHSVGVAYPETFAEQFRCALQAYMPDHAVYLYNRSTGGATATDLHRRYTEDCAYFGPSREQTIIIQCGVVDCAPRPLPRLVRGLVARAPGPIRSQIIHWLHVNRARLLRAGVAWRMTTPEKFEATMRQWIAAAAADAHAVLVVNIAPTLPDTEAHSPGLTTSIQQYNTLLQTVVREIDATNVRLVDIHSAILKQPNGTDGMITPVDGHHITSLAHRVYADALMTSYKTLS